MNPNQNQQRNNSSLRSGTGARQDAVHQNPQQRPQPQQPPKSAGTPAQKKAPIGRSRSLTMQLRNSIQKEKRLWLLCIGLALALIGVVIGVVCIAKASAPAPEEPKRPSDPIPIEGRTDPNDTSVSSDLPVVPKGITVCIDPGHGFMKSSGSYDCGSTASAYYDLTDEYEDGFALRMGLALQKELTNRGYNVVMTRIDASERVVDVEERDDLINAFGADLCISIHGNDGDGSDASGSWIMYQKNREDSQPLAEAVTEAVNARELSVPAAIAKEDNTRIVVLTAVHCPSILIEAAFLDNESDAAKAADPAWQQTFAAAIADGVDAFTSGK